MKITTIIAALVVTGFAANSFAAEANAVKPATVGGGVKNPWTNPYTVAIVVPEPASLGVLAVGGIGMLMRRRRAR